MKLDETLFDDVLDTEEIINPDDEPFVIVDIDDDAAQDMPEGPQPGPDSGVASALITAIKDEWNTIDFYNSVISTMQAEHKDDMVPVIQDIVNEENKHVGQLQKLLSVVSPNASLVKSGEQEASKQLAAEQPAQGVNANIIDPNTQAYTDADDDVDDEFFNQLEL